MFDEKKICWKNCNFNNIGVREIFSYFWGQSYARLAKIPLCILDERFGEKQLCRESAQAFRPFRNSSKTLSEFWREFFWQGGHNWILRVQMEIFLFFWRNELKERITFFEQNCIAILLGLWEKKMLRVFAAWLRQAWQNFVIPVQTNILTNNFFGNLIRFSQFLEFHQKLFRILTKNFRQCGHNCILRAQMKFFLFLERGKWRKTFFQSFASLSFSDFERKRFLVFLQAWLRQACQKFVVHVQTKIFTNKFFGRLISFSSFPEIQQNFFRVLTRKNRQGCHNCIIHVHRNIFRKIIFLSKS